MYWYVAHHYDLPESSFEENGLSFALLGILAKLIYLFFIQIDLSTTKVNESFGKDFKKVLLALELFWYFYLLISGLLYWSWPKFPIFLLPVWQKSSASFMQIVIFQGMVYKVRESYITYYISSRKYWVIKLRSFLSCVESTETWKRKTIQTMLISHLSSCFDGGAVAVHSSTASFWHVLWYQLTFENFLCAIYHTCGWYKKSTD